MKKILFLVIVLVLAGGGYYYYAKDAQAKEAAAKTNARNTAMAQKGDISITVSATGRVEPEREVEIKSKASGEVIKVNADISDQVKQGMLLFKLDPTDEERSVAKLAATLAMSKAKLEQVKLGVSAAEAKLEADKARADADLKSVDAERQEYAARLRRAQQLYDQKVVTREELDTATTKGVQTESALINAKLKIDDLKVQEMELERTRQEIPIAEAQVENDSVALEDARQRLRETEVYSPIDGVVSARDVQEGLIVASGVSNVGGGTTAMKIIDVSHIYAMASVDEADIKGIVPGIKAVVTADAYKDVEFPGKVVRVATTGVVESNVVTFDVKVEVESRRKLLLKPEMTTNVLFLVDERKDVVTVPVGAVVRKAPRTDEAPQNAQEVRQAGGEGRQAGATTRPAVAEGHPAGSGANGEGNVNYRRRQSFVTVVKPGGAEEERLVETGISDGSKIEIVSGVAEGEEVLLLQDGGDNRWAGQQGARGPRMPRL